MKFFKNILLNNILLKRRIKNYKRLTKSHYNSVIMFDSATYALHDRDDDLSNFKDFFDGIADFENPCVLGSHLSTMTRNLIIENINDTIVDLLDLDKKLAESGNIIVALYRPKLDSSATEKERLYYMVMDSIVRLCETPIIIIDDINDESNRNKSAGIIREALRRFRGLDNDRQ